MSIIIPETVKENIFKYRFQNYLIKNKLTKGGNSVTVVSRIAEYIKPEQLKLEFLEFLKEELKYGKNKRIYYTKILLSSITFLRSQNNVEQALQANNVNVSNFNNLLKEDPDDNEILYLNTSSTKDAQVNNIELCIFKEIEPAEHLDSSNPLTNYVWIDINIPERSLIIRARPYPLPSMVKGFSTNTLYNDILKQLYSLFKIQTADNVEFAKKVFYEMYKEFIVSAELPYREEIEDMETMISESQEPILQALGIDFTSEIGQQIVTRYKRLLERMLIINDIDNYNSYHEDRIAVVERIAITDDTGANANVLSGDEDGLDVTRLYFDIRETIDEIQKLDKVWIKWFHQTEVGEEEEMVEQIEMFPDEVLEELEEHHMSIEDIDMNAYSTRFTCFKKHIEINFLVKQSVEKEVQDYVLSQFKAFERK